MTLREVWNTLRNPWIGGHVEIRRPKFDHAGTVEQRFSRAPDDLRKELSDAVARGDREAAKQLTAQVMRLVR